MAHLAQSAQTLPAGQPIEMLDGKVILYAGDCRDSIRLLADNSIDAVVTDPPYALVSIQKRFGAANAKPTKDGDVYSRASAGFMGKQWDTGEVAFATEFWAEVLRVLKPGGHVAAFSGTRTYHRMTVAIEDAGFEIRDQLAWVYGSGFPKSHDVSKAIDKAAGAEREKIATGAPVKRMIPGADQHRDGWEKTNGREYQPGIEKPATPQPAEWQGWGTALKPAWEPICLARKPLIGTVAENVLEHGTGAVNVDACRVAMTEEDAANINSKHAGMDADSYERPPGVSLELSTNPMPLQAAKAHDAGRWPANIVHDGSEEVELTFPGDAARFFYSAKADANDRIGSKHPTVKPVDLMQWLCRLITPPGGKILDPFAGSGSTGEAAWREGFEAVLCEREEEYQADIQERMRLANAGPIARKQRIASRKRAVANDNDLFGSVSDNSKAAGGGIR